MKKEQPPTNGDNNKGVVVIAKEENVEVLELPFCQVFQIWPIVGEKERNKL